jgi:hypothetical protein
LNVRPHQDIGEVEVAASQSTGEFDLPSITQSRDENRASL